MHPFPEVHHCLPLHVGHSMPLPQLLVRQPFPELLLRQAVDAIELLPEHKQLGAREVCARICVVATMYRVGWGLLFSHASYGTVGQA